MRIPLPAPLHVVAGREYLVYLWHRTHDDAAISHRPVWALGNQPDPNEPSFGFMFDALAAGSWWKMDRQLVFMSEIDSSRHTSNAMNDSSRRLVYSGNGWFTNGGRPEAIANINNDLHATTVDGDSVSYSFSGTGISYIGEKSDGYGLVDVYLDGALQATVDANAAGVHNAGGQVLYQRSGLPAGRHTLRLVKKSGVYMLLDGLVVEQ